MHSLKPAASSADRSTKSRQHQGGRLSSDRQLYDYSCRRVAGDVPPGPAYRRCSPRRPWRLARSAAPRPGRPFCPACGSDHPVWHRSCSARRHVRGEQEKRYWRRHFRASGNTFLTDQWPSLEEAHRAPTRGAPPGKTNQRMRLHTREELPTAASSGGVTRGYCAAAAGRRHAATVGRWQCNIIDSGALPLRWTLPAVATSGRCAGR